MIHLLESLCGIGYRCGWALMLVVAVLIFLLLYGVVKAWFQGRGRRHHLPRRGVVVINGLVLNRGHYNHLFPKRRKSFK